MDDSRCWHPSLPGKNKPVRCQRVHSSWEAVVHGRLDAQAIWCCYARKGRREDLNSCHTRKGPWILQNMFLCRRNHQNARNPCQSSTLSTALIFIFVGRGKIKKWANTKVPCKSQDQLLQSPDSQPHLKPHLMPNCRLPTQAPLPWEHKH